MNLEAFRVIIKSPRCERCDYKSKCTKNCITYHHKTLCLSEEKSEGQ